MKKACAILLLAILSFNWIGYQVLSGFLERQASALLDQKIDQNNYDDSQLKEIRVPLNAPYISGTSSEFERYEGEIEVDGISYKYVKRRIDNNQLVLLCLPDESKTKFEQARVDFFKLVNDLGHSKGTKEKHAGSTKSFVTEYEQESNMWTVTGPDRPANNYSNGGQFHYLSSVLLVHKEPPRA